MNESKYLLLLNAEVKNYILLQNPQEKKRLREKFEFLENGMWDSGVRVKKLRGISDRVVLEARLNRDERILFSLGKHGHGTAIYLWGIVRHDDVSATAQKILPQNVPFLDFEPQSREDLPELSVDDLPARFFSMEDVNQEVPADYGPQKWLVLTDEEWKRILLASDPDTFDIYLFLTAEQEKVLQRKPPILLAGTAGSGKTTLAVYYLLRKEFLDKKRVFLTCSPFLKRFSEGIYDGLTAHAELAEYAERARKPEFHVFRDLLKEIAEARGRRFDPDREVGIREFAGIFRNHALSRKYDTELVWEEIRSIIKGAKSPVSPHRLRKLAALHTAGELTRGLQNELKEYLLGLKNFELIEKVAKAVAAKARYASYDEFLADLDKGGPATRTPVARALDEILQIVEKRAARLSEPLLTFQEYLTLGRKRAPNFLYDRREIYAIAEYYQGRLESEGRWDEIDLCKSALERLYAPDDRFLYDLVVCDEVQDFSDIQLSLIFRLAGNRRNLFLAGDPKQIINPSGFRWEEVKNRFFDRGLPVPEVHRLALNFRCVGNIVRLANALIDLKQALVGLSDTEMREEWKFNGKPPFLLFGLSEEDVLAGIRLTGAGQVLLVRSPAERQRLKEVLNTELVFTINEAKGLEFDTVFLWKIAAEKRSDDLWKKTTAGSSAERGNESHVKHELNLLYVAVTRARNTLVIYDGKSSSRVWDMDPFRDKLYRTSERGALVEVWQRASSPLEWEKQGDYFFEREYYPAAMECFKNAGRQEKTALAEAFVMEGRGRWGEAARLFELSGRPDRAAENYEKSREFECAMVLWEKLQNKKRARLCRIRAYETGGRYEEAASEWEKLEEYEHAMENWEKAGNHGKIARFHLSGKRYDKAAAAFEKAQEFLTAAECYKKAKKPREAAALFFRAGDWKSAAVLYKKLKEPQRLLQCYLGLEDFHAAGRLYEQARDIENAIKSYRKFAEHSDENRDRLTREAGGRTGRTMTLRAALSYSALSRYELSAPFYLRKGFTERAMEEYRSLGNPAGVSECLARTGKFHEAAVQMESAEADDRVEKVAEYFTNYVYHGNLGARRHTDTGLGYDKKRAERLYQEAGAFMRSGSWERALTRYRAIGFPDAILDAYLKLDRDEEALQFFLGGRLYDQVAKYLDKKPVHGLSLSVLKQFTNEARIALTYHQPESKKVLGLAARLLWDRLKKDPDEPVRRLVDDLLFGLASYPQYRESIPASLLDLALEARSYNRIFRVAVFHKPKRVRISKEVQNFFGSLKKEADRCGDRSLLAIWCYLHDEPAYDLALGDLEPTEGNFELFSKSKIHYGKVTAWLLSRNRVREAAHMCRIHGEFAESGRIYEAAGDFRSAWAEFLAAKRYEDALRCCRKAGDPVGTARVYEKMGEYEKAMQAWKDIGRSRDVARIRKKLQKSGHPGLQEELF